MKYLCLNVSDFGDDAIDVIVTHYSTVPKAGAKMYTDWMRYEKYVH